MPLTIKTLSLNDLGEQQKLPPNSKIPNHQTICDHVVRLWKEEPSMEYEPLSILHTRLKQRNPHWILSQDTLQEILLKHNLYQSSSISDPNILPLYADQIQYQSSSSANINDIITSIKKFPSCLTIEEKEPMGRCLIATDHIEANKLIFQEPTPLITIPPMDKLGLIERGKICSHCGNTLHSLSTHFIMMNGLDCDSCGTIWCSKKCKLANSHIHSILKHQKSGKKKMMNNNNVAVDSKAWNEFEKLCIKFNQRDIFSVGFIWATIVSMEKPDLKSELETKWNSLCSLSQRIRSNAADSTNIGGTFDKSNGGGGTSAGTVIDTRDTINETEKVKSREEEHKNEDMEHIWKSAFKLFQSALPKVGDTIDFEQFLCEIGRFNLNQIEGQIYYLNSFLNHNCEPNVRFEIDSKLCLKIFSRKPINKGEQLFTTYVSPLHGVNLRRRELRVNYGIFCKCNRCENEFLKSKQSRQDNNNIDNRILSDTPAIMKSPERLTLKIRRESNTAAAASTTAGARRKSSLRNKRPDLTELLKNGKEFDLEIPTNFKIGSRRRTSVRFDENVSFAVEEE
ncbi:S-adenosylmethionine-dependent methyltransferase NDAI_0D03440 [Naumovozyma dairenensis CBS 421]|uniref:Histone-lysine N-methyltransferase SET5 n=1 Tax=Naumovozyma dairenensis (strain ATCC 10597 / BCRC 20456 / CBS 421 / NBRC 0211 / NRRL Y-12639) TaxID=1071378 RepID=G0WA47_NAUDC|nr:hypothetical protein NDAI_0D03440 [Naumovozyma dairenensis CBS 421]CCD24658.1 hypothetical protein NDAI_0D03440 [Naumovozyma dairenensis CBS 421]